MAEVTVTPIRDQKAWDAFLSEHAESNFLQSWEWGEFHLALNQKIHRTGFFHNDHLVGVMLSVVEDAKRGRYLTVAGGPILDWHDERIVAAFVRELKKIAKEEHCVFVRVRPQLIQDDFSKKLFEEHHFRPSLVHLTADLTSQLDLSPTEETLLAHMRKATRYEIRKAISTGVTVTSTEDPAAIRAFYELQLDTAQRQKFVPFSYTFWHEQFKAFAKTHKVLLYTAKFHEQLLAQAFIIFSGAEAAYHYGASTEAGRQYPGAYLIQWEAIREAKRRGIQRYSFWGVAPIDQKNHRYYSLSTFKRGFGGADVEYLHAQDLVIDQPRYLFNFVVELLRKKLRRL